MPSDVRRRAKAINFGIIYGISAFGLANQLSIERSEAGDYIKKYFERFPGIRDYMDSRKQMARDKGYVETIFGRRIHYPEIRSSNPSIRSFNERASINAPIQGSAADIIRRAMIRMDDALAREKLSARMLLQVHDELIFEVAEEEVAATIPVVRAVMEGSAMPAVALKVPLQVDARVRRQLGRGALGGATRWTPPFRSHPPASLSFALTSLLIELTPGPNMTYLALVAARDGRRSGFATVAGVTLGLAVIGIVAAFGVAELVQSSRLLYESLRWAGVLFLLYLAWEGWSAGTDVVASDGSSRGRYFMRGLVTNLLNPKAAVFYVAVLPTFIDTSKPVLAQTVALTVIYVLVATLIHSAIVVLAGTLEPFLNDPRRERIARRVLSALLACVAIWFGWSTAL